MALFGRRKPGFAKEETMKPSEIPGEFSDALDPAIHQEDSNPKYREKEEAAALADSVMNGDAAARTDASAEEKQDMFEYMESLPDVEDPFPPFPEEEEAPEEAPPTPTQVLAGYITRRTETAELTPKKLLQKEIENADEMLEAMEADETCKRIAKIQGEKDVYYYDTELMTANYAMIAMLIADKDVLRTIAEMVRWNCKTYPSPTPVDYFTRHPYYLTKVQMEQALSKLPKDEKYADIKTFVSGKGVTYLFSEKVMSDRYARSLASFAEDEENS